MQQGKKEYKTKKMNTNKLKFKTLVLVFAVMFISCEKEIMHQLIAFL